MIKISRLTSNTERIRIKCKFCEKSKLFRHGIEADYMSTYERWRAFEMFGSIEIKRKLSEKNKGRLIVHIHIIALLYVIE